MIMHLLNVICKLLKKINSTYLFVYNKFYLKIKKVDYGANLIINGKMKIFGIGKITIGNDVSINSDIDFNPIGGQSGMVLQTFNHGIIIIGNNSGLSNTVICAYNGIYIGDNVCIGGDVRIYDTDFHSINYAHRMERLDTHILARPIYIKDGVWIGASCIILKGVSIGRHSIVGAGSVVTKNIPDNQIWAGNPAKFIKNIVD